MSSESSSEGAGDRIWTTRKAAPTGVSDLASSILIASQPASPGSLDNPNTEKLPNKCTLSERQYRWEVSCEPLLQLQV